MQKLDLLGLSTVFRDVQFRRSSKSHNFKFFFNFAVPYYLSETNTWFFRYMWNQGLRKKKGKTTELVGRTSKSTSLVEDLIFSTSATRPQTRSQKQAEAGMIISATFCFHIEETSQWIIQPTFNRPRYQPEANILVPNLRIKLTRISPQNSP